MWKVYLYVSLYWIVARPALAEQGYEKAVEACRQGVDFYHAGSLQKAYKALAECELPRLLAQEYVRALRGQLALELAQSQGGDKKQRLDWFEKAFDDLVVAYEQVRPKEKRQQLEGPLQQALEEQVRLLYAENQSFLGLRRLEQFQYRWPRLWHKEFMRLYLKGLIATKQRTRAKSLLLDQRDLADASTLAALEWQLPKVAEPVSQEGAKRLEDPTTAWAGSRDRLVQNFAKLMEHLKQKPYPQQPKSLARTIVQAYDWARGQKSKAAKSFLALYMKHRLNLPPAVLAQMVDPTWDRQHFKEAKILAGHILKNYPGLPAHADMYYKQARIYQDLGQHDDAIKAFGSYEDKSPYGERMEASLFNRAFSLYQLESPQASQAFQEYLDSFGRGGHATGARYLFVQSLRRQKQKQLAQQAAKELMATYPLSLYSFLLRLEEGKAALLPSGLFQAKPFDQKALGGAMAIPLSVQINMSKAEELVALGLVEDAGVELAQAPFRADRPPLMIELSKRFHDMGFYHRSIYYQTRLLYVEPHLHRHLSLDILYPRPYEKEVESALKASTSVMPKSLVLAQMRQESAFHVRATSTAGAKGLMQLMDATAKRAYARLPEPRPELDTYDPVLNIRLGIEVMNELLQRYEGNIVYALAAYNAGPFAVDRWVKARGHLDPLEFAEAIPFKETRIYVLAIYRNWLVYRQHAEALSGRDLYPKFQI